MRTTSMALLLVTMCASFGCTKVDDTIIPSDGGPGESGPTHSVDASDGEVSADGQAAADSTQPGDVGQVADSASPDVSGDGPGGGWTPEPDPSDATPPPTLSVMTAGIYVTDEPQGSEKPVDGQILVLYGKVTRNDAIVKINGTLVPWVDGFYDVGEAMPAGIGPSTKITLEAEIVGPDNAPVKASASFDCPEEAVITAPPGGSSIPAHQPLAVAWSGNLKDEALFGPVVGLYACFIEPTGSLVSQLGHGSGFVHLTAGQTNATIPIDGECKRYLLGLRAAGKFVANSGGSGGNCYVERRHWLVGQ